jgi:type III restriction enzyme
MESSDRLRHTDLVVVENTFNRAKFEARKDLFPQHAETGQDEPAGARL